MTAVLVFILCVGVPAVWIEVAFGGRPPSALAVTVLGAITICLGWALMRSLVNSERDRKPR